MCASALAGRYPRCQPIPDPASGYFGTRSMHRGIAHQSGAIDAARSSDQAQAQSPEPPQGPLGSRLEPLTMSLAVIHSRALHALEAAEVTVEVHLANGLPSFTLVGLADTEVKEARERVRAAIQNSGLEFPTNKRIKCSQALCCVFGSGTRLFH